MTKLEKLYDEIENDGIKVYNHHFSYTKKAACMHDSHISAIVLDRGEIENSAEEFTLIGEEYAHYETGTLYMVEATYNTPIERSNRIWAEGQARRHIIKKLVPFDELITVFNKYIYDGELDIDGISEHFEVTPELMKKAIDYYHQKGLRW